MNRSWRSLGLNIGFVCRDGVGESAHLPINLNKILIDVKLIININQRTWTQMLGGNSSPCS